MKFQPINFIVPLCKQSLFILCFCFTVVFFAFLPATQAQLNKYVTLNNLALYKKAVPQIGFEKAHYVNVDNQEINTMPQFLLKSNDALYVFVNGSGRLYKALSKSDSITFERIDTTYFSGYNIGSFPFIYDDTIYSLGGSGFWRVNGQLRVYVPKTKQWDIVELNKEVPILYEDSHDLIWYDAQGKKIYIGKYFQREQATKSSINKTGYVYQVKVLDLVNRNWYDLGDLNTDLRNKADVITDITSSPWGQFVMLGEKYAIIDYAHNQILYLSTTKQDQIRPLLAAANTTQLFFFKDTTFFFGNTSKNKLDSIPFSLSDFTRTSETVYTGSNKSQSVNKEAWLVLIPLAILIPVGFYQMKFKRQKKHTHEVNSTVVNSSPPQDGIPTELQSLLDEVELQTFVLILKNTLKGSSTSIDQLNKVLGVSKKTMENQKKQRSDTIISINSKYNFLTGEENIIQKRRCEEDKRSFEYFIEFPKARLFEKLVRSN